MAEQMMTEQNTAKAERESFYADVVIGAIEGGINYWAKVESYAFKVKNLSISRGDIELSANGGGNAEAVIWEDDTDTKHTVNIETVRKAVATILKDEKKFSPFIVNVAKHIRRGEFDSVDMDADLCDWFVQIGLFGKIVFG